MSRLVGLIALLLWMQPAQAAWREATTAHFIIDADTSEAQLRDFAVRLERFDATLHEIYGITDDPTRRFNRLNIIATDEAVIQKLSGNANVRGFYVPRADRPAIFTATLAGAPAMSVATGSHIPSVPSLDLNAQSILLHEYSHHFMYTNFPRAYPLWFSEGFAEFNGNVRFDPDGTVVVGTAPVYRAIGLLSTDFPITDLMEPSPRVLADPVRMDALYGRGWLLTHYLLVEGHRSADLGRYLVALNSGRSSMDAAKDAFGDLRALSKQMDALIGAKALSVMVFKPTAKPEVAIVALSPAAAALMPVHIASIKGVPSAQATSLATSAERLAAPFPRDAVAQVELAEAEFDAGRLDQADAAADRALAAAPQDAQAMLYKGRIAIQRLARASSTDAAAWKAARGWYVRANHLTPDAATPLTLYYTSYLQEGAHVPDIAFQGLVRARELAPQDAGLGLLVASHLLDTGKGKDARAVLQPIAYQPHGGAGSQAARKAVDALDAGNVEAARGELAPRIVTTAS